MMPISSRLSPRSARPAAAACAAVLSVLSCASAAWADTPPRFEALQTPKGLPFHFREDPRTPFAAITYGFRDVYALTTPGKQAFNTFGTALVMQGADGAGQTEFLERLKDLTASASLSFGPFTTQGTVRAPTSTIAPSMALVATALKNAAPNEKLLARLKQRAKSGEAQAVLRAETIAERTALWFALGDHPLTGNYDPARFDRIALDDLAQWRNAMLGRSRLRLAASGRITRDEAARIIDEAFADLPVLPSRPANSWPEIKLGGGTIVVEYDTQQSAVLVFGLTTVGPGREVETALVANAVLGGSNGRLWTGVRASLGSTYGAGSGFMLVGPGKRLITMRASVANDQINASIDALKSSYAAWRNAGITTAELRATTSRMVTDFRGSLDEPSRANGLVVGMQLANREVAEIYSYEERIGGMDLATVNKFIAEKFPSPEQLVTVIVTPRADGLGATCTLRASDEAKSCRK